MANTHKLRCQDDPPPLILSQRQPLYVVVGTGAIARRHSRVLRSTGAEVVHVRRFGTTTGPLLDGAPVVSSFAAALSRRPQACVVATAAPDHVPSACAAVGYGLDVLIEKPLAASVSDVKPLLALRGASESLIMVAYCLRFRTGLSRLISETRRGAIGRLLGFRATVGQFLPDWRPDHDYRRSPSARQILGGGVLMELSHELDLALSILGPALSVSARTARRSELEIDVEDTADLLVDHASGAVSNIHLDMTDRAATRSCRVVGSEGTLDWCLETGLLRLFRPGADWRVLEREDENASTAMYDAQFRYFEERLKDRTNPTPSVEEGLAVLRLVEAARRADASGARVEI